VIEARRRICNMPEREGAGRRGRWGPGQKKGAIRRDAKDGGGRETRHGMVTGDKKGREATGKERARAPGRTLENGNQEGCGTGLPSGGKRGI